MAEEKPVLNFSINSDYTEATARSDQCCRYIDSVVNTARLLPSVRTKKFTVQVKSVLGNRDVRKWEWKLTGVDLEVGSNESEQSRVETNGTVGVQRHVHWHQTLKITAISLPKMVLSKQELSPDRQYLYRHAKKPVLKSKKPQSCHIWAVKDFWYPLRSEISINRSDSDHLDQMTLEWTAQ